MSSFLWITLCSALDSPLDCDKSELLKLNVKKLKEKLNKYGGNSKNAIDKNEMINEIISKFPDKSKWKTKYDLVANICHKGDYHNGVFSSFVYHQPNNLWYKMDDLHVQETMAQLVTVSEAYIQLWKRK